MNLQDCRRNPRLVVRTEFEVNDRQLRPLRHLEGGFRYVGALAGSLGNAPCLSKTVTQVLLLPGHRDELADVDKENGKRQKCGGGHQCPEERGRGNRNTHPISPPPVWARFIACLPALHLESFSGHAMQGNRVDRDCTAAGEALLDVGCAGVPTLRRLWQRSLDESLPFTAGCHRSASVRYRRYGGDVQTERKT